MNRLIQDKRHEIDFFSSFGDRDEYNVFDDRTNHLIVDTCIKEAGIKAGMLVADIGCGWGVFTRILQGKGFRSWGIDICHPLLVSARKKDPTVKYVTADVERLPFATESFDAVLLSALVHHLPDPSPCAKEVHRVLKTGGVFAAFDPNRRNPFMWLYRDPESPFYSNEGVTENERPIIAEEIAETFSKVGFTVRTDYLSSLSYRYVASSFGRRLLPIYNFLDTLIFRPKFMRKYSSFVLTHGVKT